MFVKLQKVSVPLSVFLLMIAITDCMGIRFFVLPHQKKCLKNEMYSNQLAVGDYEISDSAGSVIDMTIKDSKGHVALNRENVQGKGKFAVTSDEPDYYELCFTHTVPPNSQTQNSQVEIYVDYRVGSEAKQNDPGVEHDKLNQLEMEWNRVEDLTNSIITDFAHLKKREMEMHDTNASTNTRLFYQTIVSVIVLLFLATWQILYLKTFFKTKKLID